MEPATKIEPVTSAEIEKEATSLIKDTTESVHVDSSKLKEADEEEKASDSITTGSFTAAEKGLLKTQFNLDKKPETWEQNLSEEVKELKEHIREKFDLNKSGKPTMPVLFYSWNTELEEKAKLMVDDDSEALGEETYLKYETTASSQWDKFYKNHKLGFFHNRHYLYKEIPELVAMNAAENAENSYIMCELGCGVGDTIYPLMQLYPTIKKYYVSDFSSKAIEWVKKAEPYDPTKVIAEVQDLVKDPMPESFNPPADIVTLIFVLSAISPESHQLVIQKIYDWMKPGSIIYFRDYGRYDFAQLNFSRKKGRKLKDHFYVKHDGTRVYYFPVEELSMLFKNAGFEELENGAHYRFLENRKTGLQMYRVWIQGRFIKRAGLKKEIEKSIGVAQDIKNEDTMTSGTESESK